MPVKLSEIQNYAFSNCKKLNIEKIGGTYDGLTYEVIIGGHSFYNCENIKKLSITLSRFEGDSSFENCINLESVEFEYNKPMFNGSYTFRNTALKSVELTRGTMFDARARGTYMDCKKLVSVNMTGVEACPYMFAGCISLKLENVHIDSIGEFNGYPSGIFKDIPMETVYIEKNSGQIGIEAFNTIGAKEYVVEEGNQFYSAIDGMLVQGANLMQFNSGRTGDVIIPKQITRISSSSMTNGSIDALYIHAGVTVIDPYAISLDVKDIYFEGNTIPFDNSIIVGENTVVHCKADSRVYKYCIDNNIKVDTENLWDGIN